jgi:hypothetical protein
MIETLPALLVNPLASGSDESTESGPNESGFPDPAATGTGTDGNATGTTSFFQVPARGRRIVYVIDASASMGKNGGLRAACQELVASVTKLPDTGRFQIIVYNSQAHFLLPSQTGWLEPTAERLSEVAQALERQIAEGGTEHGPALQKALSLQPDVVFFLTDADDLKQEHLRQANLLNRGQAVIHTFELTMANRGRDGMPLQILARDNRGTYHAIDLGNR